MCAARTGTILNAAELGRDLGVSAPTVKRWLSVLETGQVLQLLPPHHRNLGKRIRKSPKLHIDPGLATFHLGLHGVEALLANPSLGALVETAVVGEWMKTIRQLGENASLTYYRSADGLEVDLVIEHGGRLHGLEVKATATPLPQHTEKLAGWLEVAGRGARAALACRVPHPVTLRPGIRAVPWHLAW